MRVRLLIGILLCSMLLAWGNKNDDRYIFFLHNRFLEEAELNQAHPDFGRAEYLEILAEFEKSGFKVISEKRNGNVDPQEYALRVIHQIDSLLNRGTESSQITVVGTSKGGYIAQYVSTIAKNADLNFVFIGSFRSSDIQNFPKINYCGNILTIYEKTDPLGVSAIERKISSTCEMNHFQEIELNTGMGHGFLFKASKEWIEPTVMWANGVYKLK